MSPTAIGSPPTSAATTGVPQASASSATRPNDSLCEGMRTRSAARYHSASSGRDTGGTNRVWSATPSSVGERLELARAGKSGAAGPTEDGEHEVVPPLRVTAEQLGADAKEDVGPFEGLDAADEEQDPTVAGEPERFTRRVGVPRGERREVDAGGDHAHLGRVGVVQLDEVGRLALGVRDQPVGGLDDLGLADLAAGRLRAVVGGQVQVLDPRHGVHRVDQRHAPPVSSEPADLAGEPVVGVQHVVPALGPGGRCAHHPGGERAELARQVGLPEALVRAGRDVPHRDARDQVHERRDRSRRGPGEDVDLDAPCGQLLGDLGDVDVHAARVPGAGLFQRRGVDADHGDSPDHVGRAHPCSVGRPPVPASRRLTLPVWREPGLSAS